MNPTILFFFLLAAASALPDYDKEADQEIVVDLIKHELVSYPANLAEGETADALITGNIIRKLVDDAINNIPNPIKFEDQKVFMYFGSLLTISGSSRGIDFTGVNNVKTELLRVYWIVPVFIRVNFVFSLPEVNLNIDWVQKVFKIKDVPYICTLKGRIAIKNSTVQGTAIVNALTKKIINLSTNFKFGHFCPKVQGNVNGINVNSVIDATVTKVFPEIIDKRQNDINDYFNHLILGLVGH